MDDQCHFRKLAFIENRADGIEGGVGLERLESAVLHGSLGVLEAVPGNGEHDLRAGSNARAKRAGGAARV